MSDQVTGTREEVIFRAPTILVAEDDGLVRRFIGIVLAKAGFRTIEANNVANAREVIKAHCGSVALAICDIQMPGESGLDLAVGLELAKPGFPVLFISGLVDSIAVQSILLRDPFALLKKPFTAEALIERVHTLLGFADASTPAVSLPNPGPVSGAGAAPLKKGPGSVEARPPVLRQRPR
jgi:putative two-component system response regulator